MKKRLSRERSANVAFIPFFCFWNQTGLKRTLRAHGTDIKSSNINGGMKNFPLDFKDQRKSNACNCGLIYTQYGFIRNRYEFQALQCWSNWLGSPTWWILYPLIQDFIQTIFCQKVPQFKRSTMVKFTVTDEICIQITTNYCH